MKCNTLLILTGADCAPVIEVINNSERKGYDLLCAYPRSEAFVNHCRTSPNEFVFSTGEFRMIWSINPRYVALERFNK